MDYQNYVSRDLTHFVGRSMKTQKRRFALLKKIIKAGVIKSLPKPRGIPEGMYGLPKHTDRKLSSNFAYQGSIVCFCDIPLPGIHLHMAKYSRFGIAFRKEFLIEYGVTPVMYVPETGRPAVYHFRNHSTGEPLPIKGMSSQAVAFDRFWKYFNDIHRSLEELPLERSLATKLENVIAFLDMAVLTARV